MTGRVYGKIKELNSKEEIGEAFQFYDWKSNGTKYSGKICDDEEYIEVTLDKREIEGSMILDCSSPEKHFEILINKIKVEEKNNNFLVEIEKGIIRESLDEKLNIKKKLSEFSKEKKISRERPFNEEFDQPCKRHQSLEIKIEQKSSKISQRDLYQNEETKSEKEEYDREELERMILSETNNEQNPSKDKDLSFLGFPQKKYFNRFNQLIYNLQNRKKGERQDNSFEFHLLLLEKSYGSSRKGLEYLILHFHLEKEKENGLESNQNVKKLKVLAYGPLAGRKYRSLEKGKFYRLFNAKLKETDDETFTIERNKLPENEKHKIIPFYFVANFCQIGELSKEDLQEIENERKKY